MDKENKIKVIEGNSDHIDLLYQVNKQIPEFDIELNLGYYNGRIEGKINIILIAYHDGEPAGYMIGYERDHDNSFYCWLAAVDPKYRRQGVLKKMMTYFQSWAEIKGYDKIKVKTRNDKKAMLHFLVNSGYNFMDVESSDDPKDNVIHLEKRIIE